MTITEGPVTGIEGKRTPRTELERPLTRKKREPALVLDASGSNLEFADPEQTITKVELVCQVVTAVVPLVEGEDAEAAHETGGRGGLRAMAGNEPGEIKFKPGEDESDDPRDLHDINSGNLPQRLAQYRALVEQRGRTYLMPAVLGLQHAYDAEFAGDPDRCLEVIMLTDGKLHDPRDFEAWLDKHAGPNCVVCVGVIGFGDEHDTAVAHYQEIARRNKFLTVDALTGVGDPLEVAYDLQFMAALGD